MKRPSLQVLPGRWIAASAWLDLPQTIAARSPFDKAEACAVRVGKEDAVKAASARRRQPIYDFWSALNGEPPRVPNAKSLDGSGLTRLIDAHACFRGIRRPCAEDDDGAQFAAYVLKPTYLFGYVASMKCVAERREVPDDLVFVAYVRLDAPCAPGPGSSMGCLTHWQFVEADATGLLPIEFSERYGERFW